MLPLAIQDGKLSGDDRSELFISGRIPPCVLLLNSDSQHPGGASWWRVPEYQSPPNPIKNDLIVHDPCAILRVCRIPLNNDNILSALQHVGKRLSLLPAFQFYFDIFTAVLVYTNPLLS